MALAVGGCGGGGTPLDTGPVEVGPGEAVTNRYNNARTGANRQENVLTPGNVGRLQLLERWRVEGEIYAQVLVAPEVERGGTPRSLALVATMENLLYAFDLDAENDEPIWIVGEQRELGRPAFSARNIGGNHGILSTPVIDLERRAVFLVARDCDPEFPPEQPQCRYLLVSVDIGSGQILQQHVIEGAVARADGSLTVAFDPNAQWNRPGLLQVRDSLFVAFGSGPNGDQHEESFIYHGWLFRFAANDLALAPDVYCTTPRGRGGAVWQAGAGPAADETHLYFTAANGILDNEVHPPPDWPSQPVDQEDSVIRLPIAEPFPPPADPVASYHDDRAYLPDGNVFQYMESGDVGFGSSGPTLIPDTRLLLVGTKPALVYLLNRDTMTPVQEPLSPFDELPLQPGHHLYLHSWWGIPPILQAFVFWRPNREESTTPADYGHAYAWPSKDKLTSFRFDYPRELLAVEREARVPARAGGGNLVLSADGGRHAVLWATTRRESDEDARGRVWAFDAHSLDVLWRDDIPAWSKFTPPTVARGRLIVPSTSNDRALPRQVLVYGIRSP